VVLISVRLVCASTTLPIQGSTPNAEHVNFIGTISISILTVPRAVEIVGHDVNEIDDRHKLGDIEVLEVLTSQSAFYTR
jgi:hypothetical protein